MTSDFIDTKTSLLIMHVFGALLGAGGAFVSDGMFFRSVRDGKISETELGFLRLGSRFVLAGLAVLIVSGVFLFLLDPASYLSSSKFLAKMTIVGIIAVNGLIFHLVHFPLLRKHADVPFASSPDFQKRAILLLASGAVSSLSWTGAVILGMLRNVPYDYAAIMGIYLFLAAAGIVIGILGKKRIFHLNGQ